MQIKYVAVQKKLINRHWLKPKYIIGFNLTSFNLKSYW